jgi:N-methylhydantoinase A/oxoprolinase/acetone carboxylase beta subunit
MHFVIGIDVGGTNTDVVVLEMPEIKILSKCKVPTTLDIKSGVFMGV